jgi:hypothetical protein
VSTIANLDIVCGANIAPAEKGFKDLDKVATASTGKTAAKVESGWTKLGKGIGTAVKATGAAVVAVGAVVVAAVSKSVSVYSELEQSQTKLASSLKATGNAAGVSVQSIVVLGQELSKTTRFATGATIEAAAALTKFSQVKGPNFAETIKQAQNLAAVTGKDLVAATEALGAAQQDPLTGYLQLAAAGVRFSQAQIDNIQALAQAGDLLGANAALLEVVKANYDGAATAAGDTFAGKLDILHNSFNNIAAAVGEAVVPVLKIALDGINDWLASIDLVAVKGFAFEVVAKSIGVVADTIQVLQIVWQGVKTALLQGITFIIQGFGKLVGAIEWCINGLRELAGNDPIPSITKEIDQFAKAMQDVTNDEAGKLIKLWDKPWEHTKTNQFFENMKRQSTEAAKEMEKAIVDGPVNAMKQLTAREIEAQSAATNLIRELQQQISTFGQDDWLKKANELEAKGATAGQVEQLKKLGATLKGLDLKQSLETPFEKLSRELTKLDQLKAAGGIDGETYARARAKLVKDTQSAIPEQKIAAGGALHAGSQEARSALLSYRQSMRAADPRNAMQKVAEQQLEEQKQSRFYLQQLAKNQPQVAALSGF